MVGLNCVSSSSSLLSWWSQPMCVSRATEIMASGVSWVRCGGGCCGLSVHSSDGTKWTARAIAGRVEAQVEAQQEQRHRRAQHVHGPRQMTRSFGQKNQKLLLLWLLQMDLLRALASERLLGVSCKLQIPIILNILLNDISLTPSRAFRLRSSTEDDRVPTTRRQWNSNIYLFIFQKYGQKPKVTIIH